MFTALSILLVLGGGLALSEIFGSDDEVTEDEGPQIDEDGRILVEGDGAIRGTNADDTFLAPPDALDGRGGEPLMVDIRGEFGDDVFDLVGPDPDATQLLTGSVINGGQDEDTIIVSAGDSEIIGGTHDDRIELFDAGNNEVTGGSGEDVVIIRGGSGVGTTVETDTGADIIDARLARDGSFSGGGGSDIILIGQQNQSDAGFFVAVDGGLGADTLIYEGEPVSTPDVFTRAVLGGGAGADTFGIAFSEAPAVDAPAGTETARLDLVEILDFQPGIDRIVLDPRISDPSYEVGVPTLEVDAAADETRIIVPVTSGSAINQELVIYVNGTDVTAADVTFSAVNTLPV